MVGTFSATCTVTGYPCLQPNLVELFQESDGGGGGGAGGSCSNPADPCSFPTIPPSAVMRHNSISSEDSCHASHASIATSEAEFGQVEHDFSSVNYRKLTKVK